LSITVVFLLAFIAGVLLGVRVMLFGIERGPHRASSSNEIRSVQPLLAAFGIGFGLAGYLVSRFVSPLGAVIAALVVGLAVMVLFRWVVVKSATAAESDVEDERYVLQGHVARVVSPIAAGSEGRITFEDAGEHRTLRARALDDGAVSEGTEVVIERIEGDLAFVEPWVQVEQRL
jgi:membrane protein implicated in regulation of membrane protease activity